MSTNRQIIDECSKCGREITWPILPDGFKEPKTWMVKSNITYGENKRVLKAFGVKTTTSKESLELLYVVVQERRQKAITYQDRRFYRTAIEALKVRVSEVL